MKFTNKSISHSVRKNLREMAMDLPPENEPHPDVTDKLAQGDTPYKKVEFSPTQEDQPESNFQELLASERYRDVIAKVAEYTGQQPSLKAERGVMPLMQMTMGALRDIIQTESAHREELEQLAVDLVKNEMKIPEDAFQFDAKIVGMGEVGLEGMQHDQEEEGDVTDEELDAEVDLAGDLEHLNFEKAKRRLINGIIQGSAMKGYYMYHMVADRLEQITGSDQLIKNYGIMMSVNDSLYWQLGDQQMGAAMGGGESTAGREEVDRNTDPPTIIARGINFPVLVHELIKGVMEMFAVQGQPEDGWEEVSASEDTLEKEIWDIRLGPSIWNRIRSSFPEDILTDDNRKELQNYLLLAIFKLPARNFLVFMKEVLSGSPTGERLMNQLMQGVNDAFNDEDYTDDAVEFQADVDDVADEVDNDELNDFLGSLGIKPPEEDDDDGDFLRSLGIDPPTDN